MSYSQQYVDLVRPTLISGPPLCSLSAVASDALYQVSLQKASATARYCINGAGQQRRAEVWGSFVRHLGKLHVSLGISVSTASPVDVLVFMTEWVAGRGKNPGGMIDAAPSTVGNILSHLRQSFEEIGRSGNWSEQPELPVVGTGNPCRSHAITSWAAGYGKRAFLEEGWSAISAVPITYEVLKVLLVGMGEAIQQLPEGSVKRCLLVRDAAMFSLLWDSCLRGHDVGKLAIGDLSLGPNQPLRASLEPALRLREGDMFYISPCGVKNRCCPKSYLLCSP